MGIVAFDQVLCLCTLDGVNKDFIGIKIIEKNDVVHFMVGCEGKAAWLICRNHGIEDVKLDSSGADKMVARDMRSGRG